MARLEFDYHGEHQEIELSAVPVLFSHIIDTQEHLVKALGGESERHEQKNLIALDIVCQEHLHDGRWCGTLVVHRN